MLIRFAADAVVVIHLLFIVFVMLGGLLVLRWHWLSLLHLPAVVWGATVEFTGRLCPLTPLENNLRRAVDQSGYSGSFVDQYFIPIIYPAGLTANLQLILGSAVIVVNLTVYLVIGYRSIKRR